MPDKQRHFKLYLKSPAYQLFVSIMIVAGVGIASLLIFILAGIMIFGYDLSVLKESGTSLSNTGSGFLRYLLIVQDISLFIIPSILILVMMKPESANRLDELKVPHWKEIGLVVILAFCIFPITSFTGQLNAGMHFPVWLSGVEKWMTEKEDYADKLIDTLVNSNSFWLMSLNVVTIALIPAISEELIFRGVFQKIFVNLFKSGHIAIWFTAFIFSTLHFQFFGFIPRFILGLVFGYLFFLSGTLWLPIISHFINNSFPVILTYIQNREKINAPPDSSLLKQAVVLPVPVLLSLLILFYFRNKSNNKNESLNSLTFR